MKPGPILLALAAILSTGALAEQKPAGSADVVVATAPGKGYTVK